MPAQPPRSHQHPGRAVLAVAIAGLVAAIVPVASARAANPIDVVFDPIDAEQSWTVPAGVTSIHVELIGARGSGGGGFAGGDGHNVSGDLAVTPGSTIYVEVGGKGLGATPGFNGGGLPGTDTSGTAGAGGGASDIRTISRMQPGTIDSRLMVAGGGGGVGRNTTGGNAGQRGNDSTMGGQPGSNTHGGAGGTGDSAGSAGTLGVGGAGGTWCGFDVCAAGKAGGGGGGGYYGGGGGAGTLDTSGLAQSGSGGGGSAYTGNATNASVAVETEFNASVTITYTPGSSSSAPPVEPGEVTFNPTGDEQSWVVPDGVTSIHVSLDGGVGGQGLSLDGNPVAGGRGASVVGDLDVVPQTTLYIEVGGNGASAAGGQLSGRPGGFNGGGTGGYESTDDQSAGAGGGASDIRTVARADAGSLGSRLMIAGGGGGSLTAQKLGGDAGQPGQGTAGGGAGTSAAGGAGGAGSPAGDNGSLGNGGAGSTGQMGGGGGGGGGLYGGGGGGGYFAGAGGGGSSFTGTATNVSVGVGSHTVASITISWGGSTPPPSSGPDEGTVDATITMATSVCIELSTASVDFGTGRFGQTDVAGNPDIQVSNCGPDPVALFARGTNATAAGASWSLVNDSSTCADTLGVDAYHLRLIDSQTLDDEWGLGLTNTLLQSVDVDGSGSYGPRIDTACSGSSGAGQQMAMQIVFTATESQP